MADDREVAYRILGISMPQKMADGGVIDEPTIEDTPDDFSNFTYTGPEEPIVMPPENWQTQVAAASQPVAVPTGSPAQPVVIAPAAEVLPPDALQANSVPSALSAQQPANAINIPNLKPEAAANLRELTNQANQNADITQYTPSSSTIPGKIGEYVGKFGLQPVMQGAKDFFTGVGAAAQGLGQLGRGIVEGVSPDTPNVAEAAPAEGAAVAAPGAAPGAAAPGASGAAAPTAGGAAHTEQMTPEEKKANENILQPVRQKIANHQAAIVANDEIQKQLATEADALATQRKNIQDQIDATDTSVRFKSLPEVMQRGSFGEKLSASIALLLGGISQGLTGAKSNPVMDFIDRQVERQAEKDKLSAEQKMSLRKQLMEIGDQRLKTMSEQSTDVYRKATIDNERKKLQLQAQQMAGMQAAKAYELQQKYKSNEYQTAFDSGQEVPSLQGLGEKQRQRAVRLPNGNYKTVTNPNIAQKLEDYRSQVEPALSAISRIKELSQNYGLMRKLDPNDPTRRQIETELVGLVGNLRLPFTGPGQLLEQEYKRLRDSIGNPNKILALPAREMAALTQVETKLNSDLRATYKRGGIDLAQSNEDRLRGLNLSPTATNTVLNAIKRGK